MTEKAAKPASKKGMVYFIGAGPGAVDLITLRGLKILQEAPVVLYAGSLIPQEMLIHARKDAEIYDSASLHLDEIMQILNEAADSGKDVARLHSGDPSLYGAITEQMDRLDEAEIPYEVIPGVTAFSAAAAALGQELTAPDIAQSLIITRTAVRASAMPDGETLENFARTRTTLAIHLSINNLANITRTLIPHYGADCPVIIAYRASWPDAHYLYGTLSDIRAKVKESGITRTALIFVGPVLGAKQVNPSRLYAKDHHHVLRKSQS